ncbi:hypothetical protein EB001_23610 [bacterium]|nr:hypothetical protein [bacterium]
MDEKTMAKLMKEWQKVKDVDAWGTFGGTFFVDGIKWQVIPQGRTWYNGSLIRKDPKFVKISE